MLAIFAKLIPQEVLSKAQQPLVSAALQQIFMQRDAASAEATVNTVAPKLDSQLPKVANKLREECHEALSYLAFPQVHWRQISSKLEEELTAPSKALRKAG